MTRNMNEMARLVACGLCGTKEAEAARWYDLLWLVVPYLGVVCFAGQVGLRNKLNTWTEP